MGVNVVGVHVLCMVVGMGVCVLCVVAGVGVCYTVVVAKGMNSSWIIGKTY